MYLCGICGACSKPGQARKVKVIERTVEPGHQRHRARRDGDGRPTTVTVASPARTEIAQEIPICHDCDNKLQLGSTIRELLLFEQYKASQPKVLDRWPDALRRRPVRVG